MNDEIKRILRLLEEGKINSQQASDLIDAVKEEKNTSVQSAASDKNLKINILRDGKKKANFSIPLKFAKAIIKATGKLPVKVHGIKEVDLNILKNAIETGSPGKVLDFNTDEGHNVEMVIE
ncbi:MAG TPA: hypothetical protein VG961_10795 [Ignavibacteria bacterium]|nr:hypothetical protein [Ignavibacteria bacterium]